MTKSTKRALAAAAYYSGAVFVWSCARRALAGPRIEVLGFHRIVPNFPRAAARAIPALCLSRATFEAQLAYLLKRRDVIDLQSALEMVRGKRPLRRDACVLTFDDGYRDAYTQAFPVLRRLGLPAAVFVPTGPVTTGKLLPHDRLYATLREAEQRPAACEVPSIERWAHLARQQGAALAVELASQKLSHARIERVIEVLTSSYGPGMAPDEDGHPLTWDMCREMADAGIEIGAHTVSHAALAHESIEQARWELTKSKEDLERYVGRPARFLAYPNGSYSERIVQLTLEVGYRAALTTEHRNNVPGVHPMRLGRKLLWEAHGAGPTGRTSPALIVAHLEHLDDALLGLSRARYPRAEEVLP